ncbi:hypothetical protein TNCV_4195081 [Trichonephila clavipes]|nr:hypothetical protein TNCV_4195081 [Trichonephila clavipes]
MRSTLKLLFYHHLLTDEYKEEENEVDTDGITENDIPESLETKVLSTTWRKIYGHSPPWEAGVDRCAPTLHLVVHCQFFELFGSRRSFASKLVLLWNCSPVPELLLRDNKILLLEGR